MADYEISNLTISNGRLVIGDKVTVGFTLKNSLGSGYTIKYVTFWLNAKESGASSYAIPVVRLAYNEAVSLANGKSKSFEYSATIEEKLYLSLTALTNALNASASVRALPLAVSATIQYTYSGTQYGVGGTHEISNAYIMRSRCNPTISAFSLERAASGVANDEGENVLTTLKLAMADTGEVSNMSLKAYYAQGDTATDSDSGIDLTSDISTLLTGVTDNSTLISGTFSNGSDWDFLLVFGDSYESVSVHSALFRSFANMHLSGASTGGVCFGGFGTSTEGNPKTESYFPVYLYGGIANLGLQWTELTPTNGSTPAEYGGGTLKCCAIDNLRIIQGSVLVKPGSETIVIAELPSVEDWAPDVGVFSINACSGARIARIVVGGANEENAGKLCLSWVRNLSDGSVYTSAAIWVQCSIQYWMPVGDYG